MLGVFRQVDNASLNNTILIRMYISNVLFVKPGGTQKYFIYLQS